MPPPLNEMTRAGDLDRFAQLGAAVGRGEAETARAYMDRLVKLVKAGTPGEVEAEGGKTAEGTQETEAVETQETKVPRAVNTLEKEAVEATETEAGKTREAATGKTDARSPKGRVPGARKRTAVKRDFPYASAVGVVALAAAIGLGYLFLRRK